MPDETQAATAETQETTETTETVAQVEKTPAELKAELEGAQARIAELNKENARRRKDAEAQAAAQAEAERKAAEEQGQFKNLYETEKQTAASRAAELESATAKLDRANEILGSDIDKRIEKWPDEVKKLVPNGEGVDALTRFEKVSELAPLADRLMDVPARPGNSAGPTPSGGPGGANDKDAKEAHRRTVGYG